MSVIGEAVLSVTIEMLIEKLVSDVLLRFGCQEQILADLKKWEKMLVKIRAVLDDADEKQMTNRLVKIWLGELQNLAYDLEDILDEFATEGLRRKLLLEPQTQASKSKVRKLISSCFTTLNSRSFKFNSEMVAQIKEINTRLQDIATEKDQLGLEENSRGRFNTVKQKLPTTSLVNEAKVYGREDDKKAIIETLLSDDLSTDDGVPVISIVGMGGIGKTTLAQLIYNDVKVENHFDIKAWVHVSDDFDITKTTKSILRSIAPGSSDDNDLNMLQVELKQQLLKRKFLLVLDDIWNENYGDWTALCSPFEVGTPGSKILVTTRNQSVSSIISTLPAYRLRELSYDDCLYVFNQHSLGTKDFSMHQHLKEVGEKIVKKCKGLPLAVKTLGGLLRGKYDVNDWEYVLNSKIWDLPEGTCNVIPALRISYHYLPSHLKRCFAYCSIFPKGYEFQEKEITLLWMAEGFLQHEISEMQLEDVGHKAFFELWSRSFFQQSSINSSLFFMHDLINDLAQWAAREICLRLENIGEGDKLERISENLRHLSCTDNSFCDFKSFEALFNSIYLRTFLTLLPPRCKYLNDSLGCNVCYILSKPSRLRVLSLRNHGISELPNEIGNLKHLRYLDLSNTNIESLPDSINTLYNLQTLNLKHCYRLKKLCTDIGDVINLHHLINSDARSLEHMPLRIGKLTALRTLPIFVVGTGIGYGLGELKSLMHLRDTLSISKLENVNNVDDAKAANLISKRNLNVLLLNWTSSIDNSWKADMTTQVLNTLQPHQNLKELTVNGYGGIKFPTWLGNSSFSNLVLLRFENCYKSTSLPSVGQLPSLKDLLISGMAAVKSIGPEFYGSDCSLPFPSLKTLCFEDMEEWEDWTSNGTHQEMEGYPQLQYLSILRCSKLQGKLPEHLPALERLVIKECKQILLSISSLPKLQKLEIDGCKEMVWKSGIDLSYLRSLILSDIERMFLADQFTQQIPNLEEMKIVNCKEVISFWQRGIRLKQDLGFLRVLVIESCPNFTSLEAEEGDEQRELWIPSGLQCLRLNDCERLVELPRALWNLSFLGEISVMNCPKLVSFPDAGLPSHLRFITIKGCDALKSLPQAWICSSNMYLESMFIEECAAFTHIFRVQLPPNLKRLIIRSCNNLRTLVDEEEVSVPNNSLLEDLVISQCPNLVSLTSSGNLPRSLKFVSINECSKLESVAEVFHDNTSFECIEKIFVKGCPNLVSFLGCLASRKLTELVLNDCEKLEALPNGMHNLISLQELDLRSCPGIMTFPEGGFPTKITSLQINSLNICKALFEWGLHRFTSLERLNITGGCEDVVSFPQEEIGMLLPASLNHLSIAHFPNLKRLSSFFLRLTSLGQLYLRNCPNLKSFPESGLPASLSQLYIYRCPLLKKRCTKDKGKYWPIIAGIPHVVL